MLLHKGRRPRRRLLARPAGDECLGNGHNSFRRLLHWPGPFGEASAGHKHSSGQHPKHKLGFGATRASGMMQLRMHPAPSQP